MGSLPPVRAKLVDLMAATVADEDRHNTWVYRELRPAPVPPSWQAGQHVVGDCSKGVQYLARWAGAPDPMGNSYGPYGNSQTICLHLAPLFSVFELEPGDVVTFGNWGDQHAAMVYQAGADPLLWSFGHQGAPNFYRLSADPRPHQLRRLMVDPAPSKAEVLRARTGWFSWVAWKLGEGDWRPYGKANPAVRPAVPRRIPATWWIRYVQFLKNRNAGG